MLLRTRISHMRKVSTCAVEIFRDHFIAFDLFSVPFSEVKRVYLHSVVFEIWSPIQADFWDKLGLGYINWATAVSIRRAALHF